MMTPEMLFKDIPVMWNISYNPKEEIKQLIDNYDKTAHILNIFYDVAIADYKGYCSLCGHKMSVRSARCPFCRAEIEEDCW